MKDHDSLKRFLKVVIAIIVVAGLVWATQQAMRQWRDQQGQLRTVVAKLNADIDAEIDPVRREELIRRRDTTARSIPSLGNLNWSRIGLGSLLYLISLVPGGLVLQEATRAIGYQTTRHLAISAQILGHLGKYVPGKAMVVVMRAGRLSSAGVPMVGGSIAVVMETLFMMAVGAALAGLLVLWLPVPRWVAAAAIGGAACALLPTLPPIFARVLRKVRPQARESGVDVSWRFFGQAWLWQTVNWLLIGASFSCLVTSLPGGVDEASGITTIVACTAAISLAMVAGFISLLPGGAGVRELTLALILAPVVGPSRALLGAIAARFVFIAVELLAAGIVYLSEKRSSSVQNPHSLGSTP
ncbi:MAG: lysylphosphatidylglycerol synthase domain-containing protein [Planctomycetota bacterium]